MSRETAEQLAVEGKWDELMQLIDREPSLVGSLNKSGRTLLATSAELPGSNAIIRKLVSLGADPNIRAFDGTTPLYAAVGAGSRHGLTTIPEMRALVESGAEVDAIADSGLPTLHWAIILNRPDYVEALLALGADPFKRFSGYEDDSPRNAEELARAEQSTECLNVLLKHI